MAFSVGKSDQVRHFDHKIKIGMYHFLSEASKSSCLVRLTGPIIGVVSGLLSIATRIGLIAENVLKGTINILGCPFFKKCFLKKGLEQLLINTLGHLAILPLTVCFAVLKIATKTLFTAFIPQNYLRRKYFSHQLAEEMRVRQSR